MRNGRRLEKEERLKGLPRSSLYGSYSRTFDAACSSSAKTASNKIMQNLLSDIRSKLPKLKKVETRVQTEGGNVRFEQRDATGGFSGISNPSPRANQRCRGFVYDFRPDWQMALILPGLYLSSQDPATNIELLRSRNITQIINAASGVRNHFPGQFEYLKLRLCDLPEQNIRAVFEECFEFIDRGIASGGATLVHCNAGISRSTTIVIAYVMSRRRLRLVPALNMVRTVRPIVRPNDGFMRQLRAFEFELLKSG